MTATDRAAALGLAKRWDAIGHCETPHCDCTHNSAVTISRALLAAEADLDEAIRLAREATESATYRTAHHSAFKAVNSIASMRKEAARE